MVSGFDPEPSGLFVSPGVNLAVFHTESVISESCWKVLKYKQQGLLLLRKAGRLKLPEKRYEANVIFLTFGTENTDFRSTWKTALNKTKLS